MSKEIEALQKNPDFVILNNPLSNPKFVRAISKTETKALSIRDIYTPKLFYEIASRLKPEDLEHIKTTESVKIEIQTKQFAEAIGATSNSNFYTDLKNTAEYLASLRVPFKGKDGLQTTVGIVTKTKTDEKGKIILFIDGELAQKILEVTDHGNFSFLKEYIFGLQNGQAIKLYPFFKSWLNHGKYETGLDRFKEQFGYNTSGYRFWNNFEAKVLKQAIQEISNKTDIVVTYETTGENLDGKRPRVTGLIFRITAKEKTKTLPNGELHAKPTTKVEPTETAAPPPTPQEQPQTVSVQAVPIVKNNEPSTQEITEMMQKIDSSITPEQVTVLIEFYNPVRVWEMAKGALAEHKKKPIHNLIGFIKKSADMLGLGLWNKEHEKKEVKAKEESKASQKEKEQTIIKKIIEEYDKRATEEFLKKYNSMTPEEQDEAIQEIKKEEWTRRMYFDKATGEILEDGKRLIGQRAFFGIDYNRNQKIIGYALKYHNRQIKIDHNQPTNFCFD